MSSASANVTYTISLQDLANDALKKLEGQAERAAAKTKTLQDQVAKLHTQIAAGKGPIDTSADALMRYIAHNQKLVDGPIEKSNRAIRKTKQELEGMGNEPPQGLFDRMGMLGDLAKKVTTYVAGIFVIDRAATYLHELRGVAVEYERIENLLSQNLGSQKAAGDAIEFISKRSNDLGVSTESSLDGFTKMSQVLHGMVGSEGQKKIFEDWMKVAAAGNLSKEKFGELNEAFSTLFTKGQEGPRQMITLLREVPILAQAARETMHIKGNPEMGNRILFEELQMGKFNAVTEMPKILALAAKENAGAIEQYSASAQAGFIRQANSMHELNITMSQVLLPAYKALAVGVTFLVDALRDSIKWLEKYQWIVKTTGIVIAGVALSMAYLKVQTYLASAASLFHMLSLVSETATTWELVAALNAAAFSSIALNSALYFTLGIGAIYLLYQYMEKLEHSTGRIRANWEAIKNEVQDIMNGPLRMLKGVVTQDFSVFKGGATETANAIDGFSADNAYKRSLLEHPDIIPKAPVSAGDAGSGSGNKGGRGDIHIHGPIMPNATFISNDGKLPDDFQDKVNDAFLATIGDSSFRGSGSR